MLTRWFQNLFKRRKKGKGDEIYPDEIFLDSSNLPNFDRHQFEGRLEQPISKKAIAAASIFFALILFLFSFQIGTLQIKRGEAFTLRSENNRLRHSLLFAERGVIYDRNGTVLATNETRDIEDDFAFRNYNSDSGLAHVLGYIKYPSKDSAGFYYKEDFEGVAGVEKLFDGKLRGQNGIKIIETNATGVIASKSVIDLPKDGENVTLSIDVRVQHELHEYIKELANRVGFTGGAGVIMDIQTGELLALTSFPEFDSKILTDGTDRKAIRAYVEGERKPFLNRAAHGLYTPGSIVKPFVALAALEEGVITPTTQILSTGSISIPNPYDPELKTVFTDWKAHGYVDMREALAVSSNVYFYEIGGGFEDQRGLGIATINRYMKMFGVGEAIVPSHEYFGKAGVVPSPDWKKANFNGEEWRLGDTYNTSIGQYGFQVTPLQMARSIAALANGGKLVQPTFEHSDRHATPTLLPFKEENLNVIREGMRLGVIKGTATGLSFPDLEVAAKTGTAELGSQKQYVNSWVVGFFPYQNPKYSFAVLMERGPRANIYGGTYVMRQMLDWMKVYTPEYTR